MSIIPSVSLWLVDATLRGSALILCIWLLRPFLRRWLGARATHLLWLVVLLQLLVPWLPKSPFSLSSIRTESQAPSPTLFGNARTTVSIKEAAADRPDSVSPALAAPTSQLASYFLLLWGVGATGIGALSLLRAVRAGRLVSRAPEIGDHALLQAALAELPDVPRRLRICATRELRSPALCGILRPTILLPEGWAEQLSIVELRCVLQHEIGHLRRGDLVWHWTFLIARAVHWFNPLVWLAERSARADQEMACDEWVLARSTFVDEQTYGEVLLKASAMLGTSGLSSPLHATMAETKSGLTQRIRHLAQIRSHGWRATVAAVAVAASLLLIVAPSRSRAQVAPTDSSLLPVENALPDPSKPAAPVLPSRQFYARPQQVDIEVKLVELPNGVGQSGEAREAIHEILGSSSGNSSGSPRVESLLSPEVYDRVIRELNTRSGTNILNSSRLFVTTGQRASIETIGDFRYPTEFQQVSDGTGVVKPTVFETRNTRIINEMDPEILPDGRIKITLTTQVVEFLGFVNSQANRPTRPEKEDDALADLPKDTKTGETSDQPIFDTRKITTSIELKPGQTALVGGFDRTGEQAADEEERRGFINRVMKPLFDPPARTKKSERTLFIFVTARLLPGKSEKEAPPLPEPQQADSTTLVGIPVPGKPGFITSPHAPTAGYVDVRGFWSGTEIKCPYSGKMFRIP